jgi:tRNA(His) guanylyltransferase
MEKTLGDRMKRYEMEIAGQRMMPRLPIMARLDGRAFHGFTRGLKRPYDPDFCLCMIRTMCMLVENFNADLGYTQSDEISLLWVNDDPKREMLFDGRYHKWTSLLASHATRQFGRAVDIHLTHKSHLDPEFDCRVWQVPNMTEVYHSFLWREDDATRNSLQMAAQSVYSHFKLHKKGHAELHDLLHEKGINWNNYPAYFKRGTYARRVNYERTLTESELKRIPIKHRPTGPVTRSAVFTLDAPPLLSFGTLIALLDVPEMHGVNGVKPQDRATALYHPEDYRK